jgi:hypothetical protein
MAQDFADFDEGSVAAGGAGAERLRRATNLLGAVTSLVLVAGVGLWGYRLAVRDVAGVPVIRAIEGPMRMAPDDPGGQIAAHQGLAVNAVAAGAPAVPPAEIVLAPRPVELADEDVAGLARSQPVAVAAAATVPEAAAAPLPGAPADPDAALRDAVSAALGAIAGPAEAAPPPRSPRPQPRPAGAAAEGAGAALTQIAATAAALPAAAEVDPATLRPGTRLVQLGAFPDAETARAAWDRLAQRSAAAMAGKERVVQAATSAGQSFFRLRVKGFDSEDAARMFCAAIAADDLRCIPVTHR